MKVLMILLSVFFAVAHSRIITHHSDGDATSYQNIHIEHFHSVPTYIRKEDLHFLEHPIPVGNSDTNIEVHHGGKHDQGYAIEGHGLGLEAEEPAAHVHGDEGQDYAVGQDHHYSLVLNQGGYDNEHDGGSYSLGGVDGGGGGDGESHEASSGVDQYQ